MCGLGARKVQRRGRGRVKSGVRVRVVCLPDDGELVTVPAPVLGARGPAVPAQGGTVGAQRARGEGGPEVLLVAAGATETAEAAASSSSLALLLLLGLVSAFGCKKKREGERKRGDANI